VDATYSALQAGDPSDDVAPLTATVALPMEQHSRIEWRTLAVRGERLALVRSRASNDAGCETVHLHVYEVGAGGRIGYASRFDEDDFDGAYREFERRYCAGEGAAFTQTASVSTEGMIAIYRGDFDRKFGTLCTPEFHIESRTRSGFPDRSASDVCANINEINALVASWRMWISAACWLSPNWGVLRVDREAVGNDGEQFAWTRLSVTQASDGRLGSMCEFEPEDEEAAFAYAEERMRAATSRMSVTNRASQTVGALARAMQAHDIDGMFEYVSDQYVHDDRRRLSGDPLTGIAEHRVAVEGIFKQYTSFEWRTLAVR
jgi:hypothetical protein